MSSDVRMEQPGYDPFPQRDLGIRVFSLTRPLLELVVRKRLQEFSNIAFFESCRAREFTSVANGSAVTAVQCEYLDGMTVALPADFVVDATGHGRLTLAFLKSAQCPLPEETLIGVDISYTTVILDAPGDPPSDWKAIITFPDPPQNRRAAVILPVEGNRWLLTLGGRFETKPPNDWDGSLEYLRNMRTPTIHEAVRSVGRPSELARFGFKQSRWRHFERLESFPLALLPFGDAICRFNPIYGQGMSVAALEAQLLRKLLMAHSANRDEMGFANLASTFFAEAATIIETPWMSAAVPDFIDPLTEGERPADLKDTLKFTAGLMKLAARDPAIHKLFIEVQQLLKPRSAYRDPELVGRVRAVMAEQ